MRTLNLGILAHVDAGKTTLTERLLHTAGVIDEIGSVDHGSTQTDSLELERRRGITIKAAVVSFTIGDVAVNLIDTPGHPDFIAEVERVLNALDGAVMVISAVEGVQAQTRVLMRALERLRVPTLFFINKTDRRGADPDRVLREIEARLPPGIAAFRGSARTGEGVDALMSGIAERLPAAEGDVDGPVSGTVFKIERGARGEKIAYVRMRSGVVRTRDRLGDAKVTAIHVFDDGSVVRRPAVAAGQIAKLWGLGDVRIGDAIGGPAEPEQRHFAPPTLETVIEPRHDGDRRALRVALEQLAEQDPLIDLRQDPQRGEISVSLYGEVQKEVIQATLAEDFDVDVTFRESTTIYIERPAGSGAAVDIIDTDPNPYLATVGLRIDPAPLGSGVEFRLEVELGSMPLSFFKAVEETVEESLQQGLHGWRVTDCTVTMTHSGYWAKQSHAHAVFDKSMSSTARDFRHLTPLVVMDALRRAGTAVHEPTHRFRLEIPADALGPVLPVLGRLGAVPEAPVIDGDTCVLEGEIPAARIHALRQQLPALTRGEGVLETEFHGYRPVHGPIPSRPRTDLDPRDREGYIRRLAAR